MLDLRNQLALTSNRLSIDVQKCGYPSTATIQHAAEIHAIKRTKWRWLWRPTQALIPAIS